ncbi:hypothetical protein N7490_011315 [Penicillium lividum]|nr:hypothetical protein N7490_011315 [Penicillium lividum]
MDISNLISRLDEASASLSVKNKISEDQRVQLHQACEKLSGCLATPGEHIMKTSSGCIEPALIRVAIERGILDLFNDDQNEFDEIEIAAQTKTDPILTARLLRCLIMLRIVDVTPEGRCKSNSFTSSFKPGTPTHDYVLLFSGVYLPLFGRLPLYLQRTEYKVPDDINSGLLQDTFDTKLPFWDWMKAHKGEHDAFHRLMEATGSSNGDAWTNYIPDEWYSKHLSPAITGNGSFAFVDVGGSHGHEMKAFMQQFPAIKGHYILQDLGGVSEETRVQTGHGSLCEDVLRQSDGIEKMSHSFLDPQPVRGANIYLLSRILHDWPDREARKILGHLRDAMTKESTLFIWERVFPDRLSKVSPIDVLCDASMMAFFSAAERSESQFKDLLESTGLSLVNVWRKESAGEDTQAVLEIVLGD